MPWILLKKYSSTTTEVVIEDQDYAIFDFTCTAKFERFDRISLDVSGLERGIYIIGLSAGNYQQHTKLLVD